MDRPLTTTSSRTALNASTCAIAAPYGRRGSRVGRAMYISLALACVTMSLLGVAGMIGVLPDSNRVIEKERSAMLEVLAISASKAIARNDANEIEQFAREIQTGNSIVRSVAVRRESGVLAYETAEHAKRWALAPAQGSTLNYVRLPAYQGDKRWGVIELTFDDANAVNVLGATMSVQMRGLIVIVLGAIVVYWAAIHIAMRVRKGVASTAGSTQEVFDAMTAAVVLLDAGGGIVTANSAFWELTGRVANEMLGKSPSILNWGNTGIEHTKLPWQETLSDGMTRIRQRLVLRGDDGPSRVLNAAAAAILDEHGAPMGVLLTLDDVSVMEAQLAENSELLAQVARTTEDLHRKNQELEVLATTDLLTGCLNRRALFDQIGRIWSQATRHNEPVGCIMVDVDHFKLVNDKHGHAAGDHVLVEVGKRLRETVRGSDVVGRYGGEEFCVIAPMTDLEQTRLLAERIRAVVGGEACGGLSVTVSLGIAERTTGTTSAELMIARADNGLYAAKRSGRNRVVAGVDIPEAKAA